MIKVMGDPDATLHYLQSDAFLPASWGLVDANSLAMFNQCVTVLLKGIQQQSELGKKIVDLQSQRAIEQERINTVILSAAEDMVAGIKSTLRQVDSAYRVTSRMYVASFLLGIALIIVAGVVGIAGKGGFLTSLFGALGLLDILGFFLLKPQEKLQASRSSLAQVQAALYNWYVESINLRATYQADEKTRMSWLEVSKANMANTEQTLDMLQRYTKLED